MHAYQPDRILPQPEKAGFISAILSQHPALVGGAAISVLTMGVIFTNALWFQTGKHPSPMFTTRVIDNVKTVETVSVKPTANEKRQATALEASTEVLREVQSALSVRGYYGGKVDGEFGSKTKAAIIAFQQDHSLDQDGKPSVRLLSQILLSASASPKEVPIPKSVATKQVSKTKTTASSSVDKTNSGLVAQIQAGLKNYGYDELVVDGKPGRQTKTAIQRFQLDYGMKITGEASPQILKKLQDIGAYTQG